VVSEETGLEVRVVEHVGAIEYFFTQDGVRIHKTVHYFMREPVGGDLDRHDREFDQVRWIDFGEAAAVLTFETERALVAHAADVLRIGSAAEAAS
jgi:8-oxo-dGTP pyrophosphatase MutT (NUDIX family)